MVDESAKSLGPGSLHVPIDTNVVLDLLLTRDPWFTQAQPMWDARDAGRLFVYLPASVLTDVVYICRKQVGIDKAKRAVETCVRGFTIPTTDRVLMGTALSLPGADFEDDTQIVPAQSAGLDLIVTRNPNDFGGSPIPAIEPPAIMGHTPRHDLGDLPTRCATRSKPRQCRRRKLAVERR